MSDYERGQQDLAQEIYNIIFNQENYEWQLTCRTDNEVAHHFDDILMKIYNLLKGKLLADKPTVTLTNTKTGESFNVETIL